MKHWKQGEVKQLMKQTVLLEVKQLDQALLEKTRISWRLEEVNFPSQKQMVVATIE